MCDLINIINLSKKFAFLDTVIKLKNYCTCNSITKDHVLIPVVQVQDKTIGLVHFISIYATACFVKAGLKAKVTTWLFSSVFGSIWHGSC
jgi:hypothetical protein